MKNQATPANTAVMSVLSYRDAKETPHSYGFFYQSARALKIPVTVVPFADEYQSFEHKIVKLLDCIRRLPPTASHVLYVDATDCLFLRPLKDICDGFNKFGWPLVMGANHTLCPTSGMFMAKREWIESALEKIKDTPDESLKQNADFAWREFHELQLAPVILDCSSKLFCDIASMPFDWFEFNKSKPETPVVLKNGSTPAIVHFSGKSSVAMPFFAWTLNLVPLPL